MTSIWFCFVCTMLCFSSIFLILSSNDNDGLPTLFVVVFFSWYIRLMLSKLALCASSLVSYFLGRPCGFFSIPNSSYFFWWYSLACSILFNIYSSSVWYLFLRHSFCPFVDSGDGLCLYFLGLKKVCLMYFYRLQLNHYY